jgi:hypothetical protein
MDCGGEWNDCILARDLLVTGDVVRGEVLSYWGLLSGSKPELADEGD